MPVAQKPSIEDGARSTGPSSLVVIAGPETQKRVAAVVAEHAWRPPVELTEPAALAKLDLDASALIIFACDVEASREITELRRLCREARDPSIVVLSPPATGAGVRRTLDAGADALVFDSEIELTLAATLHAVVSGQSVVPRKLRASVERPNLSHREYQVLTLVDQGLTNAAIAETLYLAESTVKSHLASIFTKFGVHSRKEAVAVFADLRATTADPPEIAPA
jgi:DNA-binding NarL/FixJ family response regulator